MHFFLLLYSILKLNEAAFAKEEIPMFFSGIHSYFLKNDITNLTLVGDCWMHRYYSSFPLETIEAVYDIGDLGFTHFILRLLYFSYYPYLKGEHLYKNIHRKTNYTQTFRYFFKLLIKYLITRNNLLQTANYHQKFLELMALILWRVDYSHKAVNVDIIGLNDFPMSTKEFIDALRRYAYRLEDDSVMGFEKAYYSLRRQPLDFSKDKSKIFPLLLSCIHYASVIFEIGYKSMETKTADPLMLLFLLRVNYFLNQPEALFLHCRSNEIDEMTVLYFKTHKLAEILGSTKFKTATHQRAIVGDILGELKDQELWMFEVYLRLAQFRSKQKTIIY
jgi:hypothetical protein